MASRKPSNSICPTTPRSQHVVITVLVRISVLYAGRHRSGRDRSARDRRASASEFHPPWSVRAELLSAGPLTGRDSAPELVLLPGPGLLVREQHLALQSGQSQ